MIFSEGEPELWPVDRDAEQPLWEQVYDILRERIEAGDFPQGRAIPSINKLLGRVDVAEATLQKALTQLKKEGFLRGRQGRGIFVRPHQEWNPPPPPDGTA
ncbi:GntR family transcriptional regulator [Herbidospora sp. NEAU-GS84]|uniref:GntR family transcriptional regulator n=1 Tax=Herbidospora solisilvae TaxID=2696284 RepID=A0A7C9N2K6_9ACTN|nr:GntR family transcriptional regulator [Herbidospora solisilvae]NAS22434.1 GntR family transcriptional regulator [Herbidospora solisilvae]